MLDSTWTSQLGTGDWWRQSWLSVISMMKRKTTSPLIMEQKISHQLLECYGRWCLRLYKWALPVEFYSLSSGHPAGSWSVVCFLAFSVACEHHCTITKGLGCQQIWVYRSGRENWAREGNSAKWIRKKELGTVILLFSNFFMQIGSSLNLFHILLSASW